MSRENSFFVSNEQPSFQEPDIYSQSELEQLQEEVLNILLSYLTEEEQSKLLQTDVREQIKNTTDFAPILGGYLRGIVGLERSLKITKDLNDEILKILGKPQEVIKPPKVTPPSGKRTKADTPTVKQDGVSKSEIKLIIQPGREREDSDNEAKVQSLLRTLRLKEIADVRLIFAKAEHEELIKYFKTLPLFRRYWDQLAHLFQVPQSDENLHLVVQRLRGQLFAEIMHLVYSAREFTDSQNVVFSGERTIEIQQAIDPTAGLVLSDLEAHAINTVGNNYDGLICQDGEITYILECTLSPRFLQNKRRQFKIAREKFPQYYGKTKLRAIIPEGSTFTPPTNMEELPPIEIIKAPLNANDVSQLVYDMIASYRPERNKNKQNLLIRIRTLWELQWYNRRRLDGDHAPPPNLETILA